MLAGVITILQCMIYIFYFIIFFNSGVCLDRKMLGICTFSFSEYWRFERKSSVCIDLSLKQVLF